MAGRIIKINDTPCSISCAPSIADPIVDLVLSSAPFTSWTDKMDRSMVVSKIHLQSVDMFGSRVGFIKFHATVHRPPLTPPLPGIVFMRGGSVGVLVVLECEGERHILLTSQARVPIAASAFLEIPAGMLDGDGNFAGVAAKEMEEETGIVIHTDGLLDLTERAYGGRVPGVYPSCGGSDEFIRLFLYKETVDRARLEDLRGRLGGLVDHGESITLQVVRMEEAWRATSDCKTLSALLLYEKLRLA